MQPLAPGDPRQAGEFRLSARLGLGGMGQVFLGRSPAGRAVAVKICHPELAADPSFVERFAREATAAQAVNGLYTAQVVAAGPYDKPPWLATAYVPGPSLSDYVHHNGPLPEPAAWRLAAGLAEALLAVHACGLVHRDLKPSNVLLATDGPRVIDFGIASALEATSLTTTGSVMGSPPYMSPEQAMGRPAGPASDVFALGATLTFAASGAPPFGDGDAPALLFRVVHMEPALGSVPDRLRAAIAACLAKDPAVRPTLPQLLRACRDGAAAGGNSAASFWPPQMTATIARYEASSRPAAAADGAGHSGGTVPSGGQPGPHPPTGPSAPRSSPRPSRPGGGGSGAASFIRRRRMLSGLGGLVVAGGLAAAGWELTSGGSNANAAGRDADNRLAWTYKADGPVRSGPAVSGDGGTLYAGSDAGTVYALDAASGRRMETYRVGGAVSGVTVAGGTLLVGSADGTVQAFDTGTDGVSWTFRGTGAAITGAPTRNAAGTDIIYAASDDGYVYAVNVDTGTQLWRTLTGKGAMVGQALGLEVVWVGSQDGTVYLLGTDSGQVVHQHATGGTISSAPLVILGRGYVGTSKGILYDLDFDAAFANTSPDVDWTFAADGGIAGTPAPSGASVNTFFTATTRGNVYEVQPGSNIGPQPGTALWTTPLGGSVQAGPAFDGDSLTLYVGSDDGYLYAIDTSANGAVSWKYKTGGAIRSGILPKSGPNGTLVYFGSLDQRVYALHG
jgi:outer membrane protein assembly factor BamB